MDNLMKLSRDYTMRDFVEMDGGAYWLTEKVLNDPSLYRRLVRTQIEELKALYRHYPLSEFDEVGHILNRLQQAYSNVEPFDHPLLAALDDDAAAPIADIKSPGDLAAPGLRMYAGCVKTLGTALNSKL